MRNYRTTILISHLSKVLLRIIINRLNSQIELFCQRNRRDSKIKEAYIETYPEQKSNGVSVSRAQSDNVPQLYRL